MNVYACYTHAYVQCMHICMQLMNKYTSVCLLTTRRKIPWLTADSPAHTVLRKALTDPTNTNTVKMLSHGMHTGTLESMHSLILAYAPKRLDFDVEGYNARVKLAIIDHNRNRGRGVEKGTHILSS